MNPVRNINLKAVQNMTDAQALIFSHFFGRKGRSFNADTLAEKLAAGLMPEDTKKEDLEKAKAKVTAEIKSALAFLQKAGVIEPVTKDGKVVEGDFTMPAYHIEDLPEEKQIKIGEKVHTSLTANSSRVFYKGDAIMYMPHPLSPEYKAGQRVSVGELASFHVNEEGFVYLIVLKRQEVDKDGKNLKRKQCAVKASKAQLVDIKIPTGAKECVTYKKAAGLKAPELTAMPDITKGTHSVFFTNIWSPNAVHMAQIIDGLVKAGKIKNLTVINTDHQVADCIAHNIRTAPTLITFKEGKEVARIENIPAEKPNETILASIK